MIFISRQALAVTTRRWWEYVKDVIECHSLPVILYKLKRVSSSRPVGRLFVLGDMVAGTGQRVYAPKGRGGAGCEEEEESWR